MLIAFTNKISDIKSTKLYPITDKNVFRVPIYDTDDGTCQDILPSELKSFMTDYGLEVSNLVVKNGWLLEIEQKDFRVNIPNTDITVMKITTPLGSNMINFIGDDYFMIYGTGNAVHIYRDTRRTSIIPPIYEYGSYYIRTCTAEKGIRVPCDYVPFTDSCFVHKSTNVKHKFNKLLTLYGADRAVTYLSGLVF